MAHRDDPSPEPGGGTSDPWSAPTPPQPPRRGTSGRNGPGVVIHVSRPMNLGQYTDGYPNQGRIWIPNPSSPYAYYVAAYFRGHGFTIVRTVAAPTIQTYLEQFPSTPRNTVTLHVPEEIVRRGQRYYDLEQEAASSHPSIFQEPFPSGQAQGFFGNGGEDLLSFDNVEGDVASSASAPFPTGSQESGPFPFDPRSHDFSNIGSNRPDMFGHASPSAPNMGGRSSAPNMGGRPFDSSPFGSNAADMFTRAAPYEHAPDFFAAPVPPPAAPPADIPSVIGGTGPSRASNPQSSSGGAVSSSDTVSSNAVSSMEQALATAVVGALKEADLLGQPSSKSTTPRDRLPSFSGVANEFPGWNAKACSLLVLDEYSPNTPDGKLETTKENMKRSKNLWFILTQALTKDAANIFVERPEYDGKGYEMLEKLISIYAPTGDLAAFVLFRELMGFRQKPKEAIESYISRLRRIMARLKSSSVSVDLRLLVLFAVYGLDESFLAVKKDLAVNAKNYASLDLDGLIMKCNSFSITDDVMEDDAVTPSAAAAAGGSGTPAAGGPGKQSPPQHAPFNPKPPSVKVLNKYFDTCVKNNKCPLCHLDRCRDLTNCEFMLDKGYIVERNPTEAQKRHQAIVDTKKANRNGGASKKSPKSDEATKAAAGKDIAAGSASVSSAVANQVPPSSPKQPDDASRDHDEIAIAAAVERACDEHSISSNEEDLFERCDAMDENSWKQQGCGGSTPKPNASSSSYSFLHSRNVHPAAYHLLPSDPSYPSGGTAASIKSACCAKMINVVAQWARETDEGLSPSQGNVVIADTGATHHMWNDFTAFRSFHRLKGKYVTLADKTKVPIVGVGTIAIVLGGKSVLIREVYYVPALRVPLFSLRTLRRIQGCGFHGDNDGFLIFFPSFTIEVQDETDSYVPYKPLGRSETTFDYIQPLKAFSGSAGTAADPALRRSDRIRSRGMVRSFADIIKHSLGMGGNTAVSAPPRDDAVPPLMRVSDDEDSSDDEDDESELEDEAAPAAKSTAPTTAPPSKPANADNTAPGSIIPQSDLTEGNGTARVANERGGEATIRDAATEQHQSDAPSPTKPRRYAKGYSRAADQLSADNPTPRRPTTPPERISEEGILQFSSDPSTPPPPIRPCDTPNESDIRTTFNAERLYNLFGGRRFQNYRNVCFTAKDAKFTGGGEPLPSIGEFANLRKRKRGKPLPPTKHYMEKVHLDIVYGDYVSRLGYRYGLLLVDRATKYTWVYGLKSLAASNIIEALEEFRSDAGGTLPKQFRCDCDKKLLGGATRRWIYRNHSKIIGAPAGRQSANGLVERTWQTLCRMARFYLTEKQMSKDYWFFAIQHAARMVNQLPGNADGKFTTPFELVHHTPPDARTWFPIFSIVYFYKQSDADQDRANFESKAMQGIAVGRSRSTNALLVYNPSTRKYYEPDTYKFDPSRLPSTEFPGKIRYDGGIYADLYRDTHRDISEPYPPGTTFKLAPSEDSTDYTTVIVSSIPIRTKDGLPDPDKYLLTCPDGAQLTKTLEEMDAIADTPANRSPAPSNPSLPTVATLPPYFQHGSKVLFDKDGEFHKGFIILKPDGTYRFSLRRQMSARQEAWGQDLPNFVHDWPILTCDNVIMPSWTLPKNVQPSTKDTSDFPQTSAGHARYAAGYSRAADHISAGHVSARNLKADCPPSLLRALDDEFIDRATWLESYYEEKNGLKDRDTYVEITLQEYLRLRRLPKSVPRAIPTMCVLTVKKDEHLHPDRAKSRIVVLGNLEDRPWLKSDKYAPVLQYSSLRLLTSMAVEQRRKLKQGDCKNAFCNAKLPEDEITVVKPPLGDPDAKTDVFWLLKKTLYGLGRSPRHWYKMISAIMEKIGLKPSVHDPCLFIGVPSSSDLPASPDDPAIHVGMYVDDFVYFSESDEVEKRFELLLGKEIEVDFMGTVNWFLGTHFEWADHQNGALSVHLSQAAFAQHLVERHRLHNTNYRPKATPYRSGIAIDTFASAKIDENDHYFVRRRESYQSLVGSLTWLASNTRPDLSPAVSFLASYNSCPSAEHLDAAMYVVKYLRSTVSYGIAYHSTAPADTSAFLHFPFPHDAEAYHDAAPPTTDNKHLLTGYSDACWGSQLGNSVPDGDEVELFKFRSMSGYLVMRCGGPISWKAVRQEKCSRSTCEAEIRATDELVKEVLSIRHRCSDMQLADAVKPTPLFNDNQGAVDWAKGTSTKGMRHINLRDVGVRESIQAKEVHLRHIDGKVNPADIFTKEMRDGEHYRTLRDSFMMTKERFNTFVDSAATWMSASWVEGIIIA